MSNRIPKTCTLLILLFSFFFKLNAQSILDPSDPVITYDSTKPPAQPVWGQIGKWVRTVRMTWNTDMYKAYIYKGMAFRLHFPKSYAPGVNDGKKYPLMVFFHGHGEYGPIYDNEFHLLHGHQTFDNAIKNGTFDGYVISPQSTGFFGSADYAKLIEIAEYMIANNKVDPFQITVNGLSQGGQACWEMLYSYPTYVSAISPMSWSSTNYTSSDFINKVKYTPIWVFQGGKDVNPAPSTTYQVRDAMLAAGGNFKMTEYPTIGHGTWYSAWAERDFWPYNKRAYSANPWQLGGKTDFWPGQPINATLGLPAGFSGYEWRKDGALISGANSNTLNVTQVGVYDARVQRNGTWSEWSRIPITIKIKTFIPIPGRVQAENFAAMGGTQKEYGVFTEWTSDGGGGITVGWIDQGDWMDYNVNPSTAGTYTVNLRIASPNTGGQLKIKNQSGTVLTTVNLPNTGGWQTYQTVSTTVNLAAGNQILRVESSAAAMWNFNWMDYILGGTPTNQPPVANAGADKTITLPTNSVSLTGSGTDADGTIASYAWSQVSGPSTATISSAASASTNVSNLAQGTYTFRLTVKDNDGASGTDDVIVTVNPAPTSSFGKIEAENWSNMSGVKTETTYDAGGGLNVGWIDQGDWMEYTINPPASGTYTLNLRIATPNNGGQLQVRKADGTTLATVNIPNTGAYQKWQTTSTTLTLATGVQTIRIISTAAPLWNINWLEFISGGTAGNQPPTANAGADKTITLPTNSVSLAGSGTDADGSIASYAWSQVAGPSSATITAASSASTSVSNLVQGTYTFRLTVQDNDGASATDDVVVTVNQSSFGKIEAENWTDMNGVRTETTYDAGGGLNVGWIDAGDWMDYAVNPPTTGTYTLNLRVATPNNGAQLQVRNENGTILSTVNLPNTGAYQKWQTTSITLSLAAGPQTIRLISTNVPIWNINWLEFVLVASGNTMAASSRTGLWVEETTSPSFEVYPNPVKDNMVVNLNNAYRGNMSVKIATVGGAVVKEFTINKNSNRHQTTLDLGDLPKGQYVLMIRGKEWQETSKLIKL